MFIDQVETHLILKLFKIVYHPKNLLIIQKFLEHNYIFVAESFLQVKIV